MLSTILNTGFVSVILMVIALGLDGFSVSLSIGMHKIRLRRVLSIALVMGFFHFLLPFAGMVIGNFLSLRLDHITSYVGSILLISIGAYMFFSAFQSSSNLAFNPYNHLQMFSLAILVSLDSFPVGLSLGLTGIGSYFIILLIGLTAMVFSILGMLIGRRAHRVLGIYSEMLGGIILFLFGIKGLF